MGYDELLIIARVAGALAIGALIGFERTFHGRPAGFRTHALVCIASAILMIVTVYQNRWMILVEHDAIRTDPTRMAQGIMTGIGFLGAGVIFKEGVNCSRVNDRCLYLGDSRNWYSGRYWLLVCGGCRGRCDIDGFVAVSAGRSKTAKRVLCSSHAPLSAGAGDERERRSQDDR